jgi:hypothetical protein
MCVPESALYFYEKRLENEDKAYKAGFDSYEEYLDAIKDRIENESYDRLKDRRGK